MFRGRGAARIERSQMRESCDGPAPDFAFKVRRVINKSAKPGRGTLPVYFGFGRGVLIGGSDPRKDGCALGY
jgi:gamma-glutamyltranspeptidase / glutathione hydrolase